MVVLSSSAEALRNELQKEGLGKFDDVTLQHLATSLEEQYDNDEVVKAWSPFFIDSNSRLEEDSARDVCLGILQRLRSSDSSGSTATNESRCSESILKSEEGLTEVAGLTELLMEMRLDAYYPAALAWCHEVGAADLNEVRENWEELSDSLKLKTLEKKRMRKVIEQQLLPQGAAGHAAETTAVLQNTTEEPPREEPVRRLCQFCSTSPGAIPYTYDSEKALGSGATAHVYRCWREEEGQMKHYAVKIMSLHKLKLRPEFGAIRERMCKEMQIQFKLRHENVVSLYDVVADDNKIHLVMDLVEGGDLFGKIPRQVGMQEHQAKIVFLQLVYALQYIHEKGVVHRDLKPENVLVDEKASREGFFIVKITDFGHSKSFDDGYSVALTAVGTPQYWAPEVADSNGLRGYDSSVDLWSLGVMLYVMLEGQYPFPDDSQHRQALISFNEGGGEDACERHPCSEEARDLIRQLIRVSPKERISLEDCLAHQWVVGRGHLGRVADHALNNTSQCPDNKFEFLGESCLGIKQLKADLGKFSQSNACSAEAKRRGEYCEVVVTWSRNVQDSQVKESLLESLRSLLECHFPTQADNAASTRNGYPTTPKRAAPQSLVSEHSSPPSRGPQERTFTSISTPTPSNSFRLHRTTLKIREGTAGLDLVPEEGKGMIVEGVSDFPGQSGLQKDDIIHKIGQESLASKSEEEMFKAFGNNFRDGVELGIKRKKVVVESSAR